MYDRPFHDLHYEWDFNDPDAGTWEHSSKSKNVAIGAVAGHLFESAGVYDVTCNVYQYDDSGNLVNSWERSIEITVTDEWASTYIVSDTGDFTGAPEDTDYVQQTTADWPTVLGYAAADRQILLRPGGTWTHTGIVDFTVEGPGKIAPWGAGAKPTISMGGTTPVSIEADQCHDWRFVDLKFDGHSIANAIGYRNIFAGEEANQITLYGCEFEACANGSHSHIALTVDLAYIECSSTNPQNSLMYMQSGRGIAMGNDCSAARADGHSFRFYGGTPTVGGVIQHNKLGGNPAAHHALKAHATGTNPDSTAETEKVIISDNDFSLAGFTSTSVGPQDAISDEHIHDVIIEKNWFGSGNRLLEVHGATRVTVRNNIFDLSNATTNYDCIRIYEAGAETNDHEYVYVYNNTAYTSGSTAFRFCWIENTYSNCSVRNNLASAPNVAVPVMLDLNEPPAVDAANNLLTDDPGWVDPTPTNPEDFKLDPSHTDHPAIDTGGFEHISVGTYGDGNRISGPGPLGSSYDLGAWEVGAEDEGGATTSTTATTSMSTTVSTSASTTQSTTASTSETTYASSSASSASSSASTSQSTTASTTVSTTASTTASSSQTTEASTSQSTTASTTASSSQTTTVSTSASTTVSVLTTTATTSASSSASSTATTSQSSTVTTSQTTAITTSASSSASSTATTSQSSTATTSQTTAITTSASSSASSTATTSQTTAITTSATSSASSTDTTSQSTTATTSQTTAITTSASSILTSTASSSMTTTVSTSATSSLTSSTTTQPIHYQTAIRYQGLLPKIREAF